MSNPSSNNNAVSRLASQSDAIGRLAQDSGGFAAVVAAFESKDANAFRWVLERLEMLPYCELICEWVRIKLCVLRSLEICGPPLEKAQVPNLQQFARAVVQLSSNEKLLRRVVDAISCGDGSEYRAVLNELKLGDFCQLLFYWVCFVSYDRVCEIVCRPQPVPVPLQDPAATLRAAGESIAAIVKKEEILNAVAQAAVSLDSGTLQSAINGTSFASQCEFICHLICVWRLVWVCRELCDVRPPILTGAYAIEEAQNFALAAKQLASQPRALADLVNAVQNRNVEAYREIVTRYNLGPYCWQVCGWVGSSICFEFCVRVCPNPGQVTPLFTKVGCYRVGPPTSDFNANGTTVSSDLAFTGTIPLIGLIPDGSAPVALQYRFTYQEYSGISPNPNPVIPITGSMVPPTIIGTLEYQEWNATIAKWETGSTNFYVNNPGATASIKQNVGPPLTPSVNVNTDASGWIQVPQMNDNTDGGTGLFTPADAQGLIQLDTTKLTNEVFDLTGAGTTLPALPAVAAGDTMPPKGLSKKPVFQINFEAQTVSTSTPVGSNSLNAIALSNTSYTYVRHPEWPGPTTLVIGTGNGTTTSFTGTLTVPVSPGSVQVIAGAVTGKDNGAGAITGVGIAGTINYGTGAISVTYSTAPATGVEVQVDYPSITTSPLVLSVDILELDTAGGCAKLDDIIHVLYTAYHPYLGSCTVFLQGPDVASMTTPPGGTISLPIQPNQGQVLGTGNGTIVTFTGTLTTPVLPGSVQINAGAVTGNDNGSGVVSGAGISGSVNYGTGVISVTYSTAPVTGAQVLVDYNTNVSSGPAGTPFDMTDLPPCGYIVWLQATLNLTSGSEGSACCGSYYGTFSDYIPFCTVTPTGN